MSVRGEERSRKRCAVRDDERRPRRGTPDYNETPVDGRALHGLNFLRRVIFIRQFHVSPSTVRTAFAHVFHRGTPGVRSLQAENFPHKSKTVGSGIGL